MSTFAQRLTAAREAAGLSRSELARRAGLLPPAISKLEAGARQPTLATAERLADALGVPLAALRGPPSLPVPPPSRPRGRPKKIREK